MSNVEKIRWQFETEDRATKNVRKITEDIERQTARVKDLGFRSKASAEMVGSLANAMGGSRIGAFTAQVAELTDRTSAFADVAKQGGLAATAFKVGVAGAAGVLAFQFGRAIGDVVFQTKRWRLELEEAGKTADKLAQKTIALQTANFDRQKDLALLLAPDKQGAEFEAIIDRISQNIEGPGGINSQLKKLKEIQDLGIGSLAVGKLPQFGKSKETKQLEARKEALLDFIDGIRELRREQRELAQENAVNDMVEDMLGIFRRAKDRQEKLGKDMAEDMMSIFDRADNAEQKRDDAKDRVADLAKREIDSIKLRLVGLRDGKKAAEAMRLEALGLDKALAGNIAKAKFLFNEINSPQSSSITPKLFAREDRFGTGRAEAARQSQLLGSSRKTARESERQSELLDRIAILLEKIERKKPEKIKVFGD